MENGHFYAIITEMDKIEHLGIAVRDLNESGGLYARLLGKAHYKVEEVVSEQVSTMFFQIGESKIELLQSSTGAGPIHDFIEKKGEGIHHIAFAVADIRAEMMRLKAEGFKLLNDEPKKGADNKLVCFIHPRSANGVLVELCQEITDET